MFKPVDRVLARSWIADQSCSPRPPRDSNVTGYLSVVAVQIRHAAIDEPITLDLAVDHRAIATEFTGNIIYAKTPYEQFTKLSAFDGIALASSTHDNCQHALGRELINGYRFDGVDNSRPRRRTGACRSVDTS